MIGQFAQDNPGPYLLILLTVMIVFSSAMQRFIGQDLGPQK